MGVVARVLAEELQRHGKDGSDFSVVGLVLDKIGNQADKRRDFQPMQRDQRAQGTDDFHQPGRQADLFFGLAQGGEHQVRVFRVAASTGKGDFAAMGRQALGAQGQYQFGLFATGNGQ
ncbi:hypothetical protein D3C77_635680 [compost metagenome]